MTTPMTRPGAEWLSDLPDLQLLEAAGAAILITEPRLNAPGPRILYCNAAFEAMTGWARDEIQGLTPRVLQGPETDRGIFVGMAEQLERGETWRGETVNYRRDGTPYVMRWSISPVWNAGGQLRCYLAVQEDVTQERRLQREVEAARDRAQAADAAKSRFLATMGHELRTPLNAINGFSELIAREQLGPAGVRQYPEYAQHILNSGHHLKEVIDNILAVSRAESGKIDVREDEVTARTVIEGAVELVQADADGRTIRLQRVGDESLGIRGDPTLLRQALFNLLANAIKFAPEDSTVTVCTEETPNGEGRISITDTGPGIPDTERERLILPFVQGDQGLDRRHDGLGLGLYLVRTFIEAHGGWLEIATPSDGGTRASLVLPAWRVDAPTPE